MSFMENQVLGYQSPLCGRRTGRFKIEPLTYKETAVFIPDFDNALLENFFDRSAYLFEEPANLLKQELREPAVYNSVITAIAEGAFHMNEISTKTGIETGPYGPDF